MKEVSCRVLNVFFLELRKKGIPPDVLFEGVDYSIEHLRNKHERIDWDTFLRINRKAEEIWTEEELIPLGGAFVKSPFVWTSVILARLLFNEKTYYRWVFTPKIGLGPQFFTCITPTYEELSDNLIRLSLKVDDEYERFPRSYLLITKGMLIESSRQIGSVPAKVEMFEIARGGYYLVEIPQRRTIFRQMRKILLWPFMILSAGRELKETNEELHLRVLELEKAQTLLDRQMKTLKTAHVINAAVQAEELELAPTLEAIVSAMVEVAGFKGVSVTVNTQIEEVNIHEEASAGETIGHIDPREIAIIANEQQIGVMRLWSENAENNEQEELINYVVPTISVAVDDAIKYTTVLYYRNSLETKVIERTEELSRVRDELTRTVEELRVAQSARDRMFANISHEFRTPLTLIQGPVEQMLSDEIREDVRERYNMVLQNTRRLLILVNQLLDLSKLDLSKLDAGEMKLHLRKMDIVELVRGIASSFESSAKQKGIQCNIITPNEPIVRWFDPDCVEKIVTNLLSNAIKFTGADGVVEVFVMRRDPSPYNGIELTVKDTGIGIPADVLYKIFERFYQLDRGRTREYEGTGLGLALTKELVESHKGEITVTSEPGKGSTFIVTLPLCKEVFKPEEFVVDEGSTDITKVSTKEKPQIHDTEKVIEHTDETSPLLLIVEDNADMRKYMRTYLDSRYKINEAVNGIEGLEKAIETIPDLIISDVMMPKMDGFELCAKLKTDERTSHIPIILLTAKASHESKLEGLETGADDYITKPFDAHELQVRVKNLIEQRRKLRERFRREVTIKPKEVAITSADERFIRRAMEVVDAHISELEFTSEQFAKEMFLSRMQFHRKMRALVDLSPWQFVRKLRLARAADLLRRRSGNIAGIAYQVGYDSPSKFTHAFREEYGKTPSEYQGEMFSAER